MLKASALPSRYNIGKTRFYDWRNHLIKLGYDMEPTKKGQTSLYSDEQVQLLDHFSQHIKEYQGFDGFPPACIEPSPPVNSSPSQNPPNGLVHTSPEQVQIESATPEEIYVDTNPLEDIRESNLNLVDTAAQHNAAQNLAAFNYLTVDYMKHRDFTVAGLTEQVQQCQTVYRGGEGINAEHIWPQSQGAEGIARDDQHNLFPSYARVNSDRGFGVEE